MAYKKQHFIPKTYLKHFAEESFVHVIQLNHQFNRSIQKKGIGDKVFYRDQYYDFPNRKNEPVLEKMFSAYEQNYDKGIGELTEKRELGYPTKQLFIDWIAMMKMRNTLVRDRTADMISWAEQTKFGLIHGREEMDKRAVEFEKLGRSLSKKLQLMNFLDKEKYLESQREFSVNFLNRTWIVLHSGDKDFITSDNPGLSFSYSEHLERLNLSPLTPVFNLSNKVHSSHLFPLTKKLCLTMHPILWDKDVDREKMKAAMLADIKFQDAPAGLVDSINSMTIQTAYDLLVASRKEDLNALPTNRSKTTSNS